MFRVILAAVFSLLPCTLQAEETFKMEAPFKVDGWQHLDQWISGVKLTTYYVAPTGPVFKSVCKDAKNHYHDLHSPVEMYDYACQVLEGQTIFFDRPRQKGTTYTFEDFLKTENERTSVVCGKGALARCRLKAIADRSTRITEFTPVNVAKKCTNKAIDHLKRALPKGSSIVRSLLKKAPHLEIFLYTDSDRDIGNGLPSFSFNITKDLSPDDNFDYASAPGDYSIKVRMHMEEGACSFFTTEEWRRVFRAIGQGQLIPELLLRGSFG